MKQLTEKIEELINNSYREHLTEKLSEFFLEEIKEAWKAGASFIPVDPSKYDQDADDYLKSKYNIDPQ